MSGQDALSEVQQALQARRAAVADFTAQVRRGRAGALLPDATRSVVEALGARGDLTAELGVLRLMLARVVALELLDGDPHQTALTLTRLTAAIARAAQLQRILAGSPDDMLTDALISALEDLGMGAEEEHR